ncbi:ribonuclease PH [Ferrimicrobium acidiphilum]|uniref:Ribonuclease PH n=1 Tax=Ferrimicrobium acidiphilum DSM 19497 TaxID=1121877 RepID=A0A0D8FXU6_9ACTN|nr:ribonuclease PH [Ferrimicrobium acidiphilum]KJE77097.1 ribonuclease PH [Ferrimicrobium acidiphilum DSM 19497]MCL5052974.1 ribonuclease PH [Gammaproteobacteria bacterium]
MAKRHDQRDPSQLREVAVTLDYTEMALASCLIEVGKTRVLCSVSAEDRVPPWLRGKGSGWVTAEYAMLPAATRERTPREAVRGKQGGRTVEIQRLIGRSLRSSVDLKRMGEIELVVDCDVIQADGGTRTASITGASLALRLALARLEKAGRVRAGVITSALAAVSVGIVDGQPVLDLDYPEDSSAEVDMNVVMNQKGEYVEIQGTAEGAPFSKVQLVDLLKLAESGIGQLLSLGDQILAEHAQ